MKTLVNCDGVLETLTVGPVELTFGMAAYLNEHLQMCDSCRDLSEVLRPACHVLEWVTVT